MAHREVERLIGRKLRASVVRLGTVTDAEFAVWEQNPADLDELRDCRICMAGNQAHADNTPASRRGMVAILPADDYIENGPVVTCVTDINDMDDHGSNMATVQKIEDGIPQEPNTIRFKVVGYTGSVEGLKVIVLWLPLGKTVDVPEGAKMIFLSADEAALVMEDFETQKGKNDIEESHKPVHKLVRSLTMSGPKENSYKHFSSIQFLYPVEKFNDLFMRYEEVKEATDYAVLDQFSTGRTKEHLNLLVRKLDNHLLNTDVYTFSESGAHNFLSLNFGDGVGQISSVVIIKSTEKKNSISSITQRHQNLRYMMEVMHEVFTTAFVTLVADMIHDVKDEVKPSTPEEFTLIVDALLGGMSHPPPSACGSSEDILQFAESVVFDLSANNKKVEGYKRDAQAKIQAALVATQESQRVEIMQLRDATSTGAYGARSSFGQQRNNGNNNGSKRKSFNGAATTGAPKVARANTYQDRLRVWLSEAPMQPPAGRVHLCGRTAKGLMCDKEHKGVNHAHNREHAHAEEPWMQNPAYRAWAKLRPLYFEPKVSSK